MAFSLEQNNTFVTDMTQRIISSIQISIDECNQSRHPTKTRPHTRPGHPFVVAEPNKYSLKLAWTQGVLADRLDLGPTLCVGQFQLTPSLRGRGIFRAFVQSLSKFQGIDAVMFEYVFDRGLREYLENKHNFIPLDWHEPLDVFLYKKLNSK
jgi:hypothetical protein